MQTNTNIREKTEGNYIYHEYKSKDGSIVKVGVSPNKFSISLNNEEFLYFNNDILTINKDINIAGNFSMSDTQWKDEKFPASQTKRGSNDLPHFDFTNVGLLFPQNDETEIIYINAQLNHDRKAGSNISPHIHYIQTAENVVPTFVMQYRWSDNGSNGLTGDFTPIETTGAVLPYDDSGAMLQILEFPDIVGSSIVGVSSMLDIKLYRKTGDGISGDVLVKEFDIHYEVDSIGSDTEYSK